MLIDSTLTSRRDTTPPSDYPAEAHTLWHYIEGLKAYRLHEDSALARHHFERALQLDTAYAPAAYHTAAMLATLDNDEAERYSRRAYRTDTNNVWFNSQLGRLQIFREQYDEGTE